MIVFLFLSGKVSEFEGLGWKAKFKNVGAESAITTSRTSDLATTSEQTNPADFHNEAIWGFSPTVLFADRRSAKNKGKPNELDQKTTLYVATAIRGSIICGRFAALVIVDKDRKPVGFFPRDQFLELLRIPLVGYGDIQIDGEAAFRQVAGSELGVILMNPEIRARSPEARRDTVPGSENIEAVYTKMIANDVEVRVDYRSA